MGFNNFQAMQQQQQAQQYQKQQQAQMMQEMQFKEALDMYNFVVRESFVQCVKDMNSQNLTKEEETCVKKYSEKLYKYGQRVGLSFQENFQEMMGAQQK
ncbi:mitochondrial import inner membrane translocase subunit TIM9 [Acrasis kona]|uniref:Mitochondrial import inner membrane translocase subunit n=1 Tax=Acrasis kona TaxID=1008807 RepID=A0AAW2ZK57_9EUKA